MNCLLLEASEFDAAFDGESGRAQVRGRRREHAQKILKAAPGDRLRVGLVGGRMGDAEILSLDVEALSLYVRLDRDPPRKLPLSLVLALPRPPVFRRLLSTIASLGVERLLVVGTARTEKSFWQSHVVEPAAIRERLLLGLEQSRDTVVPEVTLHRYFEQWVDEAVPALLAEGVGYLAHPGAGRPCPHGVEGAVSLCIGPEGGFVDYEVGRLEGIGFEPVTIGQRVLRVEPVVPLLVGRLFN